MKESCWRSHLHDHQVLVDDGRAGGAPLVVGVVEPAGVHAPEVLLPPQGAFHVVGVEPLGAEVRDHDLPVGDRGARRLARLGMALRLRHAFVRHALPADAAGLLVDGQQAPGMRRHVGRGLDVAVEAVAERGAWITAHRGGDEDRVSPDDGAGDGETRDGRLPREPHALRGVPLRGRLVALGDAGRLGAAERGPVLCAEERRQEREERRPQDLHRSSTLVNARWTPVSLRVRPCTRSPSSFNSSVTRPKALRSRKVAASMAASLRGGPPSEE